MSQVSKIVLDNGWVLNASEWLHQPRWSTAEFGAGSNVKLTLFNYTVGGVVSSVGIPQRTATEADTNMVKRAGMAQDESMIVFAVTFDIYGLSDATFTSPVTGSPALGVEYSALNLRRLQRDAVFRLLVGADITKGQVDVPFACIAQSMGPVGFASGISSSATLDQGTSGRVSAKNQRVQQLPIYIGGFGQDATAGNAMKFNAKFENARGGPFVDPLPVIPGAILGRLNQDTRLRIVLDGLTSLPF